MRLFGDCNASYKNQKMNVYLISGLGADYRAFRYLTFDVKYTIHYLTWIEPLHNESLPNYSKRLAAEIDASHPFILIGLSFGGMIAAEISQLLHPEKTILISSAAGYDELPFLYRIAGNLRLHKLIPSKAGNNGNFLMHWLFGIKTPNDKVLLNQILTDSNTAFTKWAIDAMLRWRKHSKPSSIIRIHGDMDRVLPITSFKPDHVIKRGGHLMVVTRAEEISQLLKILL
jgi:pimeloyl-ACP methyl ester carboxylesterase